MNEIKTIGKWEEMGESEEQLFLEQETNSGLIQLRQNKVKNRFSIRVSMGVVDVIKLGVTLAEVLNLLEELRK